MFNRYFHNNEILLECTILKKGGIPCESYNDSLFKVDCICTRIDQSGSKLIINKIEKNNSFFDPSLSQVSQQPQPLENILMNGLYMQHDHSIVNEHINFAGNGATYGNGFQSI